MGGGKPVLLRGKTLVRFNGEWEIENGRGVIREESGIIATKRRKKSTKRLEFRCEVLGFGFSQRHKVR